MENVNSLKSENDLEESCMTSLLENVSQLLIKVSFILRSKRLEDKINHYHFIFQQNILHTWYMDGYSLLLIIINFSCM